MKAFIDDHHDDYGVEPICKVFLIAPSTYYLHAARKADPALRAARAQRDEALSLQIRQVWDEHFQAYGAAKSGASCSVKAWPWPVVRWNVLCGNWG
jgi:putative transposase